MKRIATLIALIAMVTMVGGCMTASVNREKQTASITQFATDRGYDNVEVEFTDEGVKFKAANAIMDAESVADIIQAGGGAAEQVK